MTGGCPPVRILFIHSLTPSFSVCQGVLSACALACHRVGIGDGSLIRLLGELFLLCELYLALDYLLQFFWFWQLRVVVGYSYAGLVHLEVLDLLLTSFGAEDESEGWKFAFFTLILVKPTEIEFHLRFVFMMESSGLEVDGCSLV